MELIIITILLTTIGLCLVALLVWLSIWSIQFMKFSKKAEASIRHTEKWIDDNQNTIMKIIEDQNNNLHNRINDEVKNINIKIDNQHSEMIKVALPGLKRSIDGIYRTMDTHVAELNSKVDSRCDKLWDDYNNRFIKMHGDNGFVFSRLDDEIKKMNEKVEYSNNRWMTHKD